MVDFTIEKYYTKQQIRRGLAHYQNIRPFRKIVWNRRNKKADEETAFHSV